MLLLQMGKKKKNKARKDDFEEEGKPQAGRLSGTMFYVNYTSNLGLSKMADHKAHILIGLNVLLLSFFVSKSHWGILSKFPGYLIPNICLTISCVLTILSAAMVSRPNLSQKKRLNDPVNWLFFADFQKHSLEEYHQAILNLSRGKDLRYEAMSYDLYWMGLALARKYRLLHQAYRMFVYGQLTTICIYLLFFAWHSWYQGH